MLNFGQVLQDTTHVCFDVPANPTVPSLSPNANIPSISLPTVPEIKNGALSFGQKIQSEIENLQTALSTAKLGLTTPSAPLNFGLPTLTDFTSKLQSLKTPQTVCISIGGATTSLSSVFDQINNSISMLPKQVLPSVQLPNISVPSVSQFVPSLNISPNLPITLNTSQILSQIQANCSQFAIDAINSLDPTEQLEQLLQKFMQLCGEQQFSQLQSVISQIEQAKAKLVQNVISSISDEVGQIQKLFEIATDAINSNAFDIVGQAANLINQIKFNSLITYIMSIDPTTAISQLTSEIQQQINLQNFSAIPQLLTAINIIQSSTVNTINNVFDAPQLEANQLQSEISNLLNLKNYSQINNLLTSFMSAQDSAINQLQQLDPATALQKGIVLLQQALQNLDLSQYTKILNAMSQSICSNGASLLPSSPSVPQINPSSIPSFLQ